MSRTHATGDIDPLLRSLYLRAQGQGITQREWAQRAGLSQAALSNALNGTAPNVTIGKIRRLADAIGVDFKIVGKEG
jgi:transcriptional regulator with XRE-family HTH domain